jgi:hypothetical protein
MEQLTVPVRVADVTAVAAPPSIEVDISGRGLRGRGVLKSVSRGGFHLLTPFPLPLQYDVQVALVHCRAILGEVVYCVKRSKTYQIGIVPSSLQKPKITVGGLAVIHALDAPFSLTRGHVLDIGNNHLSIFCKTMLESGARVRTESDGWTLFGSVESVIATSMLASCLSVRLEAAFFAGAIAPLALEHSPRSCDCNQAQIVRKDQR